MLTLIRLLKCRGPRGTVLRAPPGFVLVERHFAPVIEPSRAHHLADESSWMSSPLERLVMPGIAGDVCGAAGPACRRWARTTGSTRSKPPDAGLLTSDREMNCPRTGRSAVRPQGDPDVP